MSSVSVLIVTLGAALLLYGAGFALVMWWKAPKPRRVALPIPAEELVSAILHRVAERDPSAGVHAEHVYAGLAAGLFAPARRRDPLQLGFSGPLCEHAPLVDAYGRERERRRARYCYRVVLDHTGAIQSIDRTMWMERLFDDDWIPDTVPPGTSNW